MNQEHRAGDEFCGQQPTVPYAGRRCHLACPLHTPHVATRPRFLLNQPLASPAMCPSVLVSAAFTTITTTWGVFGTSCLVSMTKMR